MQVSRCHGNTHRDRERLRLSVTPPTRRPRRKGKSAVMKKRVLLSPKRGIGHSIDLPSDVVSLGRLIVYSSVYRAYRKNDTRQLDWPRITPRESSSIFRGWIPPVMKYLLISSMPIAHLPRMHLANLRPGRTGIHDWSTRKNLSPGVNLLSREEDARNEREAARRPARGNLRNST